MSSEEPPIKRVRVSEKEELSKIEVLDAIFSAWDRNGDGELDFEEIVPHYMKSSNHQLLQEAQVREEFEKFMKAHGRGPKDGVDLGLFHGWFGKLDDGKLAKHYQRHVLGQGGGFYDMNINKAVVKDFEKMTLKEICDSPVHAIQGIAEASDACLAALNLKTVRDLGTWRFYLLARAIVTLAEKEDLVRLPEKHIMNIRNALDREHEKRPLKQVLGLPPAAFNMFPEQANVLLGVLKISTIRQLGMRKTFAWANAIVELEKYEVHVPPAS